MWSEHEKTIVAITAAAFLGSTASRLTPAPAHAVYPIFLAFVKRTRTSSRSIPTRKLQAREGQEAITRGCNHFATAGAETARNRIEEFKAKEFSEACGRDFCDTARRLTDANPSSLWGAAMPPSFLSAAELHCGDELVVRRDPIDSEAA